MRRSKVGASGTSEGEAVDKEESENDNDRGQDAPPKPLVHESLDMLLPIHKILHCHV